MDALLRDLEHSVRILRQRLSFTIAAIATLALGIATNTAMFSVVNTVLLKPFSYPDPGRIVIFQNLFQHDPIGGTASPTEFDWWRRQTAAFENVAAYSLFDTANLTGESVPEQIRLMRVSAEFFSLFGATVTHGRLFSAEDELPNAPKKANPPQTFFQRHFGADPEVIGRRITLDGERYEIIGVLGANVSDGQLSEMIRGNGDVTIE